MNRSASHRAGINRIVVGYLKIAKKISHMQLRSYSSLS